MPRPKAPAAPRCPRCGYDQSGAIATFTESCPTTGTCSECGLHFRWRDVFFPDRERIRGFFEHARGFWPSLWAVPRTAWLVARPWAFWKRVQLHMKPRLGRAAVWVLAALLATVLLRGTLGSVDFLMASANPSSGFVTRYWMPLDPSNLGVWEWVWACPPFDARTWYAGGMGLVMWWTDGWVPIVLLATPIWALSFALLPQTRRRAKVKAAHIARAFIYSCAWLSMLLLPWIFQYLVRLAEFAATNTPFPSLFEWARYDPHWLFDVFPLAIAVWLWLAIWWLFAIRRGFRLQHPTAVWFALWVINGLAAMGIWVLAYLIQIRAVIG
ncbi:MAG: hypothetical protein R3B68_14810 [Phycisphaerales bacterium]